MEKAILTLNFYLNFVPIVMKKRKLEETKKSLAATKKEWLKDMIFDNIIGGSWKNMEFDTSLFSQDSSQFVMIFEPTTQLNLWPREIMTYSNACAWRQHGVLQGLMWNSKKYLKLYRQFTDMIAQVGDECQEELSDLGYSQDKHDVISLPRVLYDSESLYKQVDNSTVMVADKIYTKIVSLLVDKNCFHNTKSGFSKIIADYAYDYKDDVDSWIFYLDPTQRAIDEEMIRCREQGRI